MVEFSYMPSERDRWLDCGGRRLEMLRAWWIPGGLLMLAGVVLSVLAMSRGPAAGWVAVATAPGGVLLTIPYVAFERGDREAARRIRLQRHVTLTNSGLCLESEGVRNDLSWSRVRKVTDTGTHWRLDWDTGGATHLPKSAVPEADREEVLQLMELAERTPSPLDQPR